MFEQFMPRRGKKRSKQGGSAKPLGRKHRLPIGRTSARLFELLEMRTMLTAVTDLSDDGTSGSLRSAINSATAGETIALSAGTYGLTQGGLDVTVNGSLTIVGQGSSGANATIIDQLSLDRVLQVAAGASVTLENVEITGGTAVDDDQAGSTAAEGGGILNDGSLTLQNVMVAGNKALASVSDEAAMGGGIYSTGALTIGGGSVIENNSVIGANGSDNSQSANASGYGGGIFSSSAALFSVTDTTIANNAAVGGAGQSGDSGFDGLGGGVYISNSGTAAAVFNDDTITGNEAVAGAGGGALAQGGFGVGGGIEVDKSGGNANPTGSPVTVTNTTFSYNIAEGGGGAGTGGDAYGGAIDVFTSGSVLLNDTFFSNTAVGGSGGATAGSGFGGAIVDDTAYSPSGGTAQGGLSIVNVSIVSNSALGGTPATSGTSGQGTGGGIDNDAFNSDTALVVKNTLVAENTASTGTDVFGPAATTDHNLIGIYDSTAASGFSATNGDQLGTSSAPINPKLGPLQNNGGNTQTLTLLAGSPAIGAGDNAAATAALTAAGLPSTDQRGTGFNRIVNGTVDIGAYEVQASQATTTALVPVTSPVNVGQTVTLTATVSGSGTPTGVVTFENTVGGTTTILGTATLSSGTATLSVLSLPAGTNSITAVYSGSTTFSGSSSTARSVVATLPSGLALAASPTAADGATGSLRAAIAAANANTAAGGETIVLSSGTYILTEQELEISNAIGTLTIIGQGSTGPNATVIDQATLSRVLQIDPGVSVTLENVEITGGLADTDATGSTTTAVLGAGILQGDPSNSATNTGVLTLTNVAVENNKSIAVPGSGNGVSAYGGGILATGTLNMSGSTAGASLIVGNSAIAANGASGTGSTGGTTAGGGVFWLGATSASISGTTIANNASLAGSGAAGTSTGAGGDAGAADGGGIQISGAASTTVALDNDTISGNVAVGGNGGIGGTGAANGAGGTSSGGGIDAQGQETVTLDNDTVTGNKAIAGNGFANPFTNGDGSFGGGIAFLATSATSGAIQINNTTVSSNTSQGGTGDAGATGVAVAASSSSSSTADDDGAGGDAAGGGVYIDSSATSPSILSGDTISHNTVAAGAGGTGATVTAANGGDAGGIAFGGGFIDTVGTGTTTVTTSQISNNVAQGGNGGATSAGTVGTGGAAAGAGFLAAATGTKLLDSTVSQNAVTGGNGFNAGSAFGAGIEDETGFNLPSSPSGMSIVNVTVSSNVAKAGTASGGTSGSAFGAGIDNDSELVFGGTALAADTALSVSNTLVTGDETESQTGSEVEANGPDFFGAATTADHNLISDGTGASGFSGNGNQVGTSTSPINPELGALQNNGGNTDTLAPKTGSPALAAGDPAAATAAGLTTDQRGLARIVAGKVDIGAYETQGAITAPVVTASGTVNTATVGGAAVAVDSGVTVTSNDTDLTGATVKISSGTLQSGDTLHFTNQNGITGSFSGGVLTLSGSASTSQYQTALQSVTFTTTSPNTTTRAITIAAVDNSLTSNSAAESVKIVIGAPVVTPSGTTSTFTVGAAAVAVDAGVTVSSFDADLTGAKVTISSGTLQSGDTLHFTNQNGITGSFSGGTLTLSGSATPAQYQTALQSVTFSTTSLNVTTRSITITALDNSLTSNAANESVKVVAAPVVTASGTTNTFNIGGVAVAVDSGITVTSGDTDLTSATMTISSGTLQSGDTLSFTNQNGITGSFSGGVLTLSGSATPAQYQAALRSVAFSTTSTDTATRSIAVVAIDNSLISSAAAESVKVAIAPPVVKASGTTNTFRSGGAAVAVDAGVAVTSSDTDLTGAKVTISNVQSGDTLNFTNQNGITGSFSGGVLTLSGSATPAQYQTALQSVTFSTTSVNPTARSITITALDNSVTSNAAAESVKVIAPPVVTPTGTTGTFTVGGSAVAVDAGITVSSNDTDLTGATMTISPGTLQTGDTLHFTNQNGITGSFSGGVLTLSGSATPAQYQTALQSVTFSTTSTNTTTRSIAVVASDSLLISSTAAESVKVAIAPPVLKASGTTNTFTSGGAAVAVDSGLTVSSFDTDLTGAKVTISNVQSGDTLNFTNQNGITGSFSGGVLTLSGGATPAQYQTALQSVTFSTTSNSAAARSITVVALDNSLTSNAVAETVDVIVAPVVTPTNAINTFTVGGSAIVVDAGITVSSNDTSLTGATLTISPGTLQTGDTLNFTNQNGITGSFSGSVLTLSGSATPAQYQAALRSVTFSTTSTVTTLRTIVVVASDDALASAPADESVKVAIAPPVLKASGTTNTFTVDGAAVAVDSGVTVSSEGVDLTGATITISNVQSGDTLNFTNQNGITGSFAGGVLTLSGAATPAQYQVALQSVTFSTTSDSPVTRSLAVVALDGSLSSNSAAESVKVIAPPVVTASGTTNTFTVGGSAIVVDAGITVSSNDTDLTGATMTISPGTLQTGDTLNFTTQNGITGSFSGGVLTLSGSATPAQYQAALQSVTFSTTSTVTTARSIAVVALDNALSSTAVDESVKVAFAAPVVTASGTTGTFKVGGTAVAVDSGVTVTSDDPDITGATVTISNVQTGDTLNFTNQNGITGSFSAGVLTLSGSATPAQYQTALQSVTFSTTGSSSVTRTLAIVALDGSLSSDSAAESVKVIAAPVVTASGTTGTFNVGGAAVAVDSGLTVSSNDTDLTGATLTISSGTLQTGDTLNFTNQNGITGSFSGGVLTLTGSATPAQYQTALQSVTFSTTSTTTTARAITAVALDGSLSSNSASETVDVAAATASLSGTVYDDIGKDGTFDSSETTLDNITVTLTGTDSSGNTVNQTAVTNSSGAYSFSGLVAGTYSLAASLPTDLMAGTATAGSAGGTAAGEVISSITLAAGATGTGYNFGTYGLAAQFININLFLASTPSISSYLNQGPTISSMADQSVAPGVATPATSFTVGGDSLALAASLTVTGTSSNTTLVPNANIVYGGSGADRTITVTPVAGQSGTTTITTTVTDPYGNQNFASFTLTVTANPVVTPSGTTSTFTVGGSAVAVDAGVQLSSSTALLTSATVTISSATLQSGDTLNFTTQNGITGSFSGGVLTLSGSASVANYQTALQSVTFSTTSSSSVTRSLSIVATDNSLSSTAATESIKVISTPVVTSSGVTHTATIGGSAVTVDSGLTVSSGDTDLTGATVTISSGTLQSGDTLNFVNQNGITGSFSGGVLTLSGSATPAQYQAALQSVTFSTTSTNTTARSLAIVALDGSLTSNSAAETVDVTFPAPVVAPSGTTGTFRVGGSAVAVDAAVTVTSGDSDLTGATVTISSGTLQSGDTLNFTNQNGITGSFSGGVLTLSGSATPAQYQAALQSVTFSTSSNSPVTRSITVVALDNLLVSNAAAESVKVIASPIVTPSGSTNTFTVGGSAVAVDAGLTVSSNDTDLTGATLTISSGTLQTGDTLNFANQNGITGSFSGGVLTLSGSATPAQYQTALQSVTFSTTSGSSVTRSLSIVAADNSLSSSTAAAESVKVIAAPVVTPSGTTNAFTTGGTAVPVDSDVTVSSNDTDLTGATLTISSGTLQTGDMLNFVNQNGITGNYTAGALTLSGSATPAQYQAALQSVTFSTTSANTTTRAISVVALDHSLTSDSAAESVKVAIGAPVVTASGTTDTAMVGGAAVAVDSGVTVSSFDSDLTGATVTISPGTLQSGDALNFTNQNGISGSFSGGVLTLSGSATPAQYQTALQSVTFATTSANTTTRAISIVALDNSLTSNSAVESVKVAIAAPVVTPSGTPASVTVGGAPLPVDFDITVSSFDNDLTGATLTISPGTLQAGDTLGFFNQSGITGSYSNGVLTLSGSATPAQYQTALQTVTFSTTSTNTTTRAISVVAFDNSLASNSAAESVDVEIAPPFVSPSGTVSNYLVGGAAVAVDSGVTVSSFDTDLTGATVTISSDTLQSGDTLHFTNQNGITGSFSGGVLTLSGSATPAQYQTALQSITFSSANANDTERSISIVAVDNSLISGPAAESINVIGPPVVTPFGNTNIFTVGGPAVTVDANVSVSSSDTDLTGAKVTISSGTLQTGDTLNFTNQNGITGAYSGGVLTLSGSATVADYQTALQSVTFSTTSTNTTTRSLSIVALDNSLTSASAAENVAVAIAPPVLTASGATNTFTIGGTAVAVDSGLTASSSDTDLTGATVTISSGTLQSGDALQFTNQNGITGHFSGGMLLLSGNATVADYQAALASVTFSTTSANTTARAITIVAFDNALTSNSLAESVDVAAASPMVAFATSAQSATDAAMASEDDWVW